MAPLAPTGYALLVAMVGSLVAVRWFDDPEIGWLERLRSRLLLGVPWGSLLAILGVLCVYLFVQGGLEHWRRPVTLPFRAWSYLYPLGVLTAGFSHVGAGHLVGNLVGAAVFAPVAEYAWGHYPRKRGSSTFSSLRTNPFARVLAVPLAAFIVGVVTSAFAIGPVIGFSSVVFAFAGFAVVHYPLTTLIALLSSQALQLVYDALRNPVTTRSAHPGFFSPGFAEIAIQGHAIGMLTGVVLGIGLALYREQDRRPAAARVWIAVFLFGVVQSLWQVYWFRGDGAYVLYRALGVALVFALAIVVAAAVTVTDRSMLAAVRGSHTLQTARRVGPALVLVAALVGLGAPAVPVNLQTIADPTPVGMETSGTGSPIELVNLSEPGVVNATGANASANATGQTTANTTLPVARIEPGPVGDGVDVRGYTVTYAENVTNKKISVFNISIFNVTTQVDTSGVIVRNPSRHIWTTGASTDRLKFTGTRWIRLGGPDWRGTVRARRTGWSAVGDGIAYRITLRPPDGEAQLAYTSGPATAEPTIAGRNVTIAPTRQGFSMIVARPDGGFASARVPDPGANVTLANLTVRREGDDLYATTGNTRVRVASAEDYR